MENKVRKSGHGCDIAGNTMSTYAIFKINLPSQNKQEFFYNKETDLDIIKKGNKIKLAYKIFDMLYFNFCMKILFYCFQNLKKVHFCINSMLQENMPAYTDINHFNKIKRGYSVRSFARFRAKECTCWSQDL